MFNFFKKKDENKNIISSGFEALKSALSKTSKTLIDNVVDVARGDEQIDEFTLEDIETMLIKADLGVDLSVEIVEKINADGPKNLAKAAKENDCVLVHISTDYVFGGDLDISKEYKEDDPKKPVTAYGITKLHGEEYIEQNTDKYYIFRTAWLYGDGNNFVRTMLKLGETKDELNVVSDQHGSPTYAEDLANFIGQAIEKKIPYGVYHATNEGFTTWYDFTKAIFEYAGIICQVNPVSTEKYIEMMKITQAKRPKNSQMSKEKLKAQGIEVPEWEDGLKRYLKEEGKL